MATAEVSILECPPDTIVEGGVPIAVLAVSPEELTSRASLKWHDDEDELDRLRFAIVRVSDEAPPFLLLAYEHDPSGSVTVLGPAASADDGELDKLLAALHIEREEILDRVDELRLEPARSLELVRDAEDARMQIERQLEAIRALAARLQRDLAKQLAETRVRHENAPAWLPALLEKEGFANLTDRQQKVVLLLLQGSSTDEVAQQLSISRGAVTQTLARARRRLADPGAARASSKTSPS